MTIDQSISMGAPIVAISRRFQVVIPVAIRRRLNLKPGQRVRVIEAGGCMVVAPVRAPHELMGVARGRCARGPRSRQGVRGTAWTP
ncbi:MAG: AbrB/MazE/SpoVT family DNA-binding domain-containing protein [Candidatus Eisenbacteria bacterium]|nr:AbrB/MazE/SpoVT family DNA-binding domain-containing protein [Candidatus Eisenbacteria bacterium]